MTSELVTIFIIVSIAQGLFVIFMLWRVPGPSRYANLFLALTIVCFVWYQLEFLLIKNKIDWNLQLFYGTRFGSWLLLGPFIWLYVKSFFQSDFKWSKNYLLHFVPFVTFTLIIPILNENLLTWRSVDYGMLTVFDNWNQEPITLPQYAYGSIFYLQFLHAGFYLARGILFVKSFEKEVKDQFSNYDPINFRWHKNFLYTSFVIILFVSSYILFQFVTQVYSRMTDYFYVVPMTAAIYFLLYHAIKYPNLIFKQIVPEPTEKYQKSSLPNNVSQLYVEKIQSLIEDQKLYLNRELRLKDLAEEMDVSTHHLSQAINENLNRNFFDLINQYRVEAAKNEITKNLEKPILQVAFEVGFNNKVSFNNAFKKYVGMTPSRYRQSA